MLSATRRRSRAMRLSSSTSPRPVAALFVVGLSACLGLAACATDSGSDAEMPAPSTQAEATQVVQLPDGVVAVETRKITAVVVAVDRGTRQVTLRGPRGGERVIEAGPDVVNLDEIDVGDEVEATVMQSVAVRVDPEGNPSAASAASGVAVVPRGASEPGVIVADTVDITAHGVAVGRVARQLVVKDLDGRNQVVHVGPGPDLSRIQPGESLHIRMTETIAIGVVELP
jgi:hypothetical protein